VAVAVPLLLAAAVGCGADRSGNDGSAPNAAGSPDGRPLTSTPTPSDVATTGTRGETAEALSVRLVVSGGIAGVHEVYEIHRDDGRTAAARTRVRKVLALAADPAVRDLADAGRRGPAVRCCDLRVFDVTVRYADGTRASIRTAEGTPAPLELRHLIAMVSPLG
jgi:hypothetical protein